MKVSSFFMVCMLLLMAKRFLILIVVVLVSSTAWAQAIEYTLSFPAPEHRWMQVEVRFPNVPAGPLQVRMARTSPGRYALHEFAKNVFDVSAVNSKGQRLTATRPIRTNGILPITTARSSSPTRSSATAPTAPISASTTCTPTSIFPPR